ncbi:class I SAM-dependent methyltransferase [Aestuariibaculum marinum]|uniref:Class I SAM-dependent methyltransferase n=1 Tax=Aestuariibaculum marinum TaxID=2683592 RepID=A0A8J6PYH9_9FLAO|nr:methyltransferase domain-containing protein [Aestuariibaculum marinum]MBD0823335.1 class I SAM-dependent methyltransferase [Aestuariibaculum marinum]
MVKENETKVYLKVKDHSVTGEEFSLVQNSEYGFLETVPQPSLEKLPDYYKSEDYISHTDAKRNAFEKVYHLVRSYALNKKLQLINSFQSESKTILDVGCGTGDFLQTAQNNGWTIFGVEPNKEARGVANQKTNDSVFDIDQLLKFEPHSFDVITLWHVLEHLPNLEEQVSVFKTLLKPNGTLVIAVPNFKSYDAKYYKSFWAAFDVPRHLWHFDANSISKLFATVAMEVEKINPMLFDAFYVSLLSEKYKSGKMNFIKGFFVGLQSNIKALTTKEASSLIYILKNAKK